METFKLIVIIAAFYYGIKLLHKVLSITSELKLFYENFRKISIERRNLVDFDKKRDELDEKLFFSILKTSLTFVGVCAGTYILFVVFHLDEFILNIIK